MQSIPSALRRNCTLSPALFVLTLLASALVASDSFAQATTTECFASDAAAAAYDDGWQSGDNDGLGFGAWTLTTTSADGARNGHFPGNSTFNGDGIDDNADDDINVGGRAWGIFANDGNIATAVRALSTIIGDGASLSLAFDNGFVEATGGMVLFELSGIGGVALRFGVMEGATEYFVTDAGGTNPTGIAVSEEGLRVTVEVVSGTGDYNMTITRLEDGSTTSLSGSFVASTDISEVVFINDNAGPDPPRDLFVNSLEACYQRIVDITPPICRLVRVLPGPPTKLRIRAQDEESGLAAINVLTSRNATVNVPGFAQGTNNRVVVVAEKVNPAKQSSVVLEVVDVAGNVTVCDPVVQTLSDVAPESFSLQQNYPNPFNPTTTIRFEVAEAGHVSIRVFDVSGREVATLADQMMEAGTFEVNWDGRDASGGQLASGLYLYRLETGAFGKTMRMTLLN